MMVVNSGVGLLAGIHFSFPKAGIACDSRLLHSRARMRMVEDRGASPRDELVDMVKSVAGGTQTGRYDLYFVGNELIKETIQVTSMRELYVGYVGELAWNSRYFVVGEGLRLASAKERGCSRIERTKGRHLTWLGC